MRVALDVDGVLADFTGAWCAAVNHHRGVGVYDADYLWPADITEFGLHRAPVDDAERAYAWAAMEERGACTRLSPLASGLVLYEALHAADHELLFLTAAVSTGPTWAYERKRWLATRVGPNPVVFASGRHKFLVDADVLVDDNLDNVLSFVAGGRHGPRLGVVWAQPWNQVPAGMGLPLGVMRTDDPAAVAAALGSGGAA